MSNKNKKPPSFLFVGHLALDSVIRFKKKHKPSIGGTVTFGSLALRQYSKNVEIAIVSNLGRSNFDKSLLKPFNRNKIDLDGLIWSDSKNTNFILEYADHSRILTLKSKSPNLNYKDIPPKYAENPPDVVVLAPLCNEITSEYVSKILDLFPEAYIGIDLQGFIRNIDEDGSVSYIHNEEIIKNMCEIIEKISDRLVLKGSEIEMKMLSNEKDPFKVMEHFEDFNNRGIYIMTLGEKGSLISKKGNPLIRVPAFKPRVVVDETGAGDVYLAIFLYELITSDLSWNKIRKSGYLASAAASYLVEKKGPTGFKEKIKIEKRVSTKTYINN